MKAAKQQLIRFNGTKCMLCGKDMKSNITWHHIIPRCQHGEDTYENGALLCPNCHRLVHNYPYDSEEYERLTQEMLKNKR